MKLTTLHVIITEDYYVEETDSQAQLLTFHKPEWFDRVKSEYWACREGVCLIDMSSFTKIELKVAVFFHHSFLFSDRFIQQFTHGHFCRRLPLVPNYLAEFSDTFPKIFPINFEREEIFFKNAKRLCALLFYIFCCFISSFDYWSLASRIIIIIIEKNLIENFKFN